MRKFWLLGSLGLFLLCACNSASPTPLPASATKPPTTATVPQNTSAPYGFPSPTIGSQDTQGLASFPLSKAGPYLAGNVEYTFVDESRNDREIEVTVWYPALEQKDAYGRTTRRDAPPDTSGAPYPLILTEQNSGTSIFDSHLVSYGFVMVSIIIPDHSDYFNFDFQMVDWPRDFLFILDQIASNPPEGLEGVIDSDHAGATGYSYGGDISLTLSGVRIDPEYYLAFCEQPPTIVANFGGAEWYHEFTCGLAEKWDEFAARVGKGITASDDGLWQPVTDERIRVVMPMAPSGTWLYGERGLASANRPVLMIAATEDQFSPYTEDTAFLFEHLGSPQKSLISFIDKSHMMVLDYGVMAQMKHFATAFFGYHLQGREDYAEYFSEDFVAQFDDLAWGVYQE